MNKGEKKCVYPWLKSSYMCCTRPPSLARAFLVDC